MLRNFKLLEVDEIKITIVMDNTIDVFMPGCSNIQRFESCSLTDNDGLSPLIAEHGFSAVIQTKSRNKENFVLLDAGVSPNGILHNLKTLGIDVKDMQAIVLSHGHADHTLGLPGIIEKLGPGKAPLVAHPDAFLERKVVFPGGREMSFSPPLELTALHQEKLSILKKADPSLLADDTVLVSGEIPRITDFETGFPIHYTKRNGEWENDPFIRDDQCVIVNVRGQGLVIVTGCGHSGIINTIRYAQALTKIEQVHAVVGGFHLTGGFFEKLIPNTIAELQKIKPTYLMPGHCTGWAAIHQMAQMMPEAFIPNNVGTTLVFQAK